jgi:hypothetical protein
MDLYIVAGLGIVLITQALLFRIVLRQQRSIEHFEDRFGRLTAGVSLLTDTTECGLRDVAREVERLGQAAPAKKRANAAVTRRIRTAARRGRKVAEIAAAEQVSEGEVRLRLHLADSTHMTGVNGAAMR